MKNPVLASLIFMFLSLISTGSAAEKELHHNHANEQANPVKSRLSQPSSDTSTTKNGNTSSNKIRRTDSDDDVFLRIKTHMKDMNATSGDELQFKCKVDGRPKNNIRYTWYYNNVKISSRRDRFFIISRPWGSKLLIKNLYTIDSGVYRCEASNGFRRVHSSARLKVSFKRPPVFDEKEKIKINLPQGKCEKYKGTICKEYFGEYGIYTEELEDQDKLEDFIQKTINAIGDSDLSSSRCRTHAIPALCYYMFRPCTRNENGDIQRGERLCREDCELLKREVCHNEFSRIDSHNLMTNQSSSSKCSFLSFSNSSKCKKQNFTQIEIFPDECYKGNGEDYRGKFRISETGLTCEIWPDYMVEKNPLLLSGHNYCRNLNGLMDKPWCIVKDKVSRSVPCRIQQCKIKDQQSFLFIIVGCCGAVLFIIGVLFICCIRKHCNNKHNKYKSRFSTNFHSADGLNVSAAEHSLTNLNPSSIQIISELGTGNYGKIYKAVIVEDCRFDQYEAHAVISMGETYLRPRLEKFKRDISIMAPLQHSNIASLKGVVLQPNNYSMIFEYTDQINLHEYLVLNSPSRDGTKRTECKGHAMSSIDNVDFMEMAVQISYGMLYLSSNNYIHRDLATRNILVCGNMDLKISNLGLLKDSELTNYYTSPQGKLYPIRWMAPESLHSWKFSDKSTVWSFGVVLWEMFSYGLQPYCGYSNHEVLDMISRRQLLSCPDQCLVKIYSLMQECWGLAPKHRPSFKEIHDQLRTLMEAGEVMLVKSAYFNRNPIGTSSPPPEYQSHSNNPAASWNGNYAPSEQSCSSAAPSYKQSYSSRCYQQSNEVSMCHYSTDTNTLVSCSNSFSFVANV